MSAVLRPAAETADFIGNHEPHNPVRIYVSRDVAYNLDKLMTVTKNVLGKLGCDECHSGRILDFVILEDFMVNPKSLEVTEVDIGRQF
jgi:hypothetical protein